MTMSELVGTADAGVAPWTLDRQKSGLNRTSLIRNQLIEASRQPLQLKDVDGSGQPNLLPSSLESWVLCDTAP